MPAVSGKRKTGAAAASKAVKKIQKTQDIRKSLSVLQPAADNPTSLVGFGGSSASQKIKKQKPLLDCKENSPMKTRRAKRRAAVTNCEKLEVKSSTPISDDSKSTKASVVGQQTLTAYCEKLNAKLKENNLVNQQEDQKETLEHSKHSLSGISIPSESSGYFSDCAEKLEGSFKSDASTEKLPVVSADVEVFPEKNACAIPAVSADVESFLGKDACIISSKIVQNSPSVPEDVYDMLISDKVPQSYWRDLAEQRRLALEEALRENESLHDQVEVLQTLNASLRSRVDDAEKLAEAVKDILGDQ